MLKRMIRNQNINRITLDVLQTGLHFDTVRARKVCSGGVDLYTNHAPIAQTDGPKEGARAAPEIKNMILIVDVRRKLENIRRALQLIKSTL